MINTDTKTKVSNSIVPLHLYSFDAQKLINKFHDQIVKEINESKKKDFNAQMAISRDFNCLYINAWWDRDVTGLRPTKLIKRDNRSDSEFATYILQGYMDYLQREREKQSKMNFEQICDLVQNDKHRALFSQKAYIDWIIDNLNKIQCSHGICFNYMFDVNQNRDRAYEDYFFKRLIVQLAQCNKINSYVISQIAEYAEDISYEVKRHYPTILIKLLVLSSQLQSFIENSTILHQKFTNLTKMNYSYLFMLFNISKPTTLQAPLASSLDYDPYNDMHVNMEFYLTNETDLQEFINAFITNEDDYGFTFLTKVFAKQKLIVYFKDYQNLINNQIKAIHNDFRHVQKLDELADTLSLLLKHAIYKDCHSSTSN